MAKTSLAPRWLAMAQALRPSMPAPRMTMVWSLMGAALRRVAATVAVAQLAMLATGSGMLAGILKISVPAGSRQYWAKPPEKWEVGVMAAWPNL